MKGKPNEILNAHFVSLKLVFLETTSNRLIVTLIQPDKTAL